MYDHIIIVIDIFMHTYFTRFLPRCAFNLKIPLNHYYIQYYCVPILLNIIEILSILLNSIVFLAKIS